MFPLVCALSVRPCHCDAAVSGPLVVQPEGVDSGSGWGAVGWETWC